MKKIIAFVAATALTLASLTACGAKTVTNYETYDSGTVKYTLNIPDSLDVKLDTGSTGMSRIRINAETISVPNVSTLGTAYVMDFSYDEEGIKELIESIFDKDADVYASNPDNLTKDEIQQQIDYLSACLESYAYSMDKNRDELIAETKAEIANLEADLENATEEYPLLTEYAPGTYASTINDERYTLEVETNSVTLYRDPSAGMMSYREALEGTYTDCYFYAEDAIETDVSDYDNYCEASEETCLAMAEAFLGSVGLDDFGLAESCAMVWDYCLKIDGEIQESAYEMDGYVFKFTRQVSGVSVANVDLRFCSNTSLSDDEGNDYAINNTAETAYIFVDANGVCKASWSIYYEPVDGGEERVDLLDWDALLDAMNTSVAQYLTDWTLHYSKVTYDKMELTYWLAATGTEGVYAYTPVWLITANEDESSTYYFRFAGEALVVDAVTGQCIYLVDNAREIGILALQE